MVSRVCRQRVAGRVHQRPGTAQRWPYVPWGTHATSLTSREGSSGLLLKSVVRAVQHMCAGAVAGIAEHVAMYPVDTIKTRMQALGHPGQRVRLGVSALANMPCLTLTRRWLASRDVVWFVGGSCTVQL